MTMFLKMDDVLVTADYRLVDKDNKVVSDRSQENNARWAWVGTAVDTFAGKRAEFTWTGEELAAVTALMHGAGEDGWEGYDVPALYRVAELACSHFPEGLRLIP